MNRRRTIPVLLITLMLLGLLVIIAALAWLAGGGMTAGVPFSGANDAPPAVFILQPGDATQITSGQGLVVAVYAASPAGVNRIDFLVDGRLAQQFVPDEINQEIQTVFPWFSSRAGTHRLSVIAYDRRNRSSAEAAVQVDVRAAGPLPELVQAGAESGGGPSSDDGEDQPQEVQPGAEVAQGDPPPPLPEAPQDAPPVVDRFEILADVSPEAVSASISGAGSDDLGLARLKVEWRNDAGEAGDFVVECGGQQACNLDTAVDLGPGPWLFAFRAIDTSGQSSLPEMESVEVVGGPGLPPAVADHAGFDDWLRDHVVAVPGELPINPGFDLDDFLDGFVDDGPAEAGEVVQADGQCLSIGVEPRAEGNLVTITIRCELQVQGQDVILLPYVGKTLVNTGDGGISLFVREWYDNRRTRLSPGDSLTWLDWDVTCGTTYRYSGRVDEGRVLDYQHDSLSSVGILGNQAFASAEATTPACARGAIADVNLRAAAAPGGVQVRWDVAAGGQWPADLPADGVRFILTRFDPESEETFEIYNDILPSVQLPLGRQFTVLDDGTQCGDRYWYSLAGVAADADMNLVSPGWLLRAQVQGPELPCPAQDVGSIQLRVTPYWFNEANVRVRLQMQLPPGFAWPQGEGVELQIVRMRQGENRCDSPPCLGNWQVKKSIPITDGIRRDGLNYEDDDTSVSFGDYVYVYRLAVVVNRAEVQSGPNVSAVMPPSPPPPPEIVRLTLSNNCPGGAARCATVEWRRYEQPGGRYYSPAARIAVERITGALDRQLFPVDLGATRFVDTDPFVREIVMANGQVRRICIHETTYRMVAFDAQGHSYGASPLTVLMPDCNARWDMIVEPRQR